MSESQPHRDELTDAEQRARSKEVYKSVIQTVDHNSGRVQPPLASKPSIVGTLNRGGYDLEEISRAITVARRNGDLFQTEGPEGRKRLGIDDPDALREKISSCLEYHDDPPGQIIGIANARVRHHRPRYVDEVDDDD